MVVVVKRIVDLAHDLKRFVDRLTEHVQIERILLGVGFLNESFYVGFFVQENPLLGYTQRKLTGDKHLLCRGRESNPHGV